MKLFNNIRLDIYFKNGVSARDDSFWLINFDYTGMHCAMGVNDKNYDIDRRNNMKLKIIGVDEL